MSSNTISLPEFDAYVGHGDYAKMFFDFSNARRKWLGLNFWALMAGVQWFIYRKIYWVAVIVFLAEVLVFQMIKELPYEGIYGYPRLALGTAIFFFWRFLVSLSANYVYYASIKLNMKKYDSVNFTNDLYLEALRHKGGTNFVAALSFGLIVAVVFKLGML